MLLKYRIYPSRLANKNSAPKGDLHEKYPLLFMYEEETCFVDKWIVTVALGFPQLVIDLLLSQTPLGLTKDLLGFALSRHIQSHFSPTSHTVILMYGIPSCIVSSYKLFLI